MEEIVRRAVSRLLLDLKEERHKRIDAEVEITELRTSSRAMHARLEQYHDAVLQRDREVCPTR